MRRVGRWETALFLVGILLVGSYFRFVGLDWGEDQAIHPDEEFLRQVVSAVRLPDRLATYFDTASSPLNPHNRGHGFFVYGTLPLFLTRAVGEGLDRGCEPTVGDIAAGPSLAVRLLAPIVLGRPADGCWPGAFSSGTGARMVGRALAALFELGSLIFVFLIGRRLHSVWVGLLGGLLYALAVLPIQQAHFFTVDAFANFFVAATLYLAVRAAQIGGWGSFVVAGVTTGLGMACKVSAWPLGLVVALAGVVWGWSGPARGSPEGTTGQDERQRDLRVDAAARVVLAGIAALLAFRVAQPYAFEGPGFFGLRPNEQWLGNLAEIRRQMSGAADVYHGHQWTNRAPLLFPWINMVFWGLGLPLGLAAWAGWALAGLHLFRWWRRGDEGVTQSRYRALLLLWIWGIAYFLYQGTQWVKSIRYLLPIYPGFVLLAAWLLVRLVRWAWRPQRGARARALVVGVGGLVLVGTLCWALALTSIYLRSHTRIASSRWILENVPTAATAHVRTAEGERRIPLEIGAGVLSTGDPSLVASLSAAEEADLVEVTLNHVVDPRGDPDSELVRVVLAADSAGETVLAEVTREVEPPPGTEGVTCAFSLGSVRLVPGTTYYLRVDVVGRGPIQLFTSVLATEHWDWAPPLRVDGHDPFGGMYRGLSTSSDGQLQLYHDDTSEKRENLLRWLNEADYIITGSNRLYASIPRLPTRYPLTIAYYRALFNGELGFELVADFTSYLALGPFQFPDQEEPFAVPSAPYQYRAAPVSVPVPPAEEAFSVYDHPRVLVFRKTDDYTPARAEEILDPALLEDVVWGTAREVTRGTRDGMLDPETWAEQQAGGTWSEMFDRQGLLNRIQWLGTVVWYLAAATLGWVAFPLVFTALPGLTDRGYGFARALGLLVVAFLTWLAASLRILPNTRATVALAVLLLAAAGGVTFWRRRGELCNFLRNRWKLVATYEGLFLILFVAWTWVRALNPDLWHPVVGGEKPMDFAYLNAVIKSTWFPPYDPWFAGGYMNYYYFGFVLVGSLAKLLGIMPSIAHNLALSLFYALTGGAAFSLAYNLVGAGKGDRTSSRPYIAGLLAVFFVLVLGNLGEVRLLVNGFQMVAGEPTFESTIPGLPRLVQAVRGFWMVLRGARLPFRPETPYWDPTRMPPHPAFVEFPAFTFLYGDLHAHMLALPYALSVLGLALNWARGGLRLRRGWLLSCFIGGLVIGAFLATNTWDYPTYLLLGLTGLALGVWRQRSDGSVDGSGDQDGNLFRPRIVSLGWRAGLLTLVSVLLFLPYVLSYVSPVTRLEAWRGERIPLNIYLLMVGQFLFPFLTLLSVDGRRALRSLWRVRGGLIRVVIGLGLGGAFLLGPVLAVRGVPVALVAIPVGGAAVAVALAGDVSIERRMVWLLLALSMALSLGVELVAVGGDRMNTVFKFSYQIWTFLAVGAAVVVVWVMEEMGRWSPTWQEVWWAAMALLVFCMALFPAMSIPAKVNDRFTQVTGPTLDGMAYMEYSRTGDVRGEVDLAPDYAAIVWMQESIEGSPVILEGLGEREYLWGNRVSIYTGLPTVIGWRWHQVQQRMGAGADEVGRRRQDVEECYSTENHDRAWRILKRYNVRYIYVGPYERLYYGSVGLVKFDAMVADGRLRVVYDQDAVRIYEVVQ